MPSAAAILIRSVWLAALLAALLAREEGNRHPRYRWWGIYLADNILLAPFYWPELPGWYDDFWTAVLAISILRLIVGIEAIHFQVEDCRYWTLLTGGVYLFAFALTAIAWEWHGDKTRDIAIQLRRYGQLWIGVACILAWTALWAVGGLRKRWQDRHLLLVTLLCVGHAAVTVLFLAGPHDSEFWQACDQWATAFDATLYLSWAYACGLQYGTAADPVRRVARIAPRSAGR